MKLFKVGIVTTAECVKTGWICKLFFHILTSAGCHFWTDGRRKSWMVSFFSSSRAEFISYKCFENRFTGSLTAQSLKWADSLLRVVFLSEEIEEIPWRQKCHVHHFRLTVNYNKCFFLISNDQSFRLISILKYFEKKKFSTIFRWWHFLGNVTLTPWYGTSGSKLKKSLGDPQARIHVNSKKEKRKEWDDAFSLWPRYV